VAAYAELLERGELTARVAAAPTLTRWQNQAGLGLRRAFGSPWLRLGALKGFADGSLGSTTAFFYEPYSDAPGTTGLLADEMHPIEAMRERLAKADAAGLQLCLHAIGDRAISTVLDLFEDVLAANGPRDRRWRIEHAQHVAPSDFSRFAALGVIASVQPYHAIDDGRWAEGRIGPERAKTTYAFRSFLDAGVRLALGTDWYVGSLNPMETLYAAVTRATLDGKRPGGWVPAQKITLAEAVSAYTAGAAYAEFQENEKGRLVAGQLADLVVLDQDVFAVPAERLRDVKVVTTVVGGRVVYRRER
jgi:predicted amidohydrolase YtcJ